MCCRLLSVCLSRWGLFYVGLGGRCLSVSRAVCLSRVLSGVLSVGGGGLAVGGLGGECSRRRRWPRWRGLGGLASVSLSAASVASLSAAGVASVSAVGALVFRVTYSRRLCDTVASGANGGAELGRGRVKHRE